MRHLLALLLLCTPCLAQEATYTQYCTEDNAPRLDGSGGWLRAELAQHDGVALLMRSPNAIEPGLPFYGGVLCISPVNRVGAGYSYDHQRWPKGTVAWNIREADGSIDPAFFQVLYRSGDGPALLTNALEVGVSLESSYTTILDDAGPWSVPGFQCEDLAYNSPETDCETYGCINTDTGTDTLTCVVTDSGVLDLFDNGTGYFDIEYAFTRDLGYSLTYDPSPGCPSIHSCGYQTCKSSDPEVTIVKDVAGREVSVTRQIQGKDSMGSWVDEFPRTGAADPGLPSWKDGRVKGVSLSGSEFVKRLEFDIPVSATAQYGFVNWCSGTTMDVNFYNRDFYLQMRAK